MGNVHVETHLARLELIYMFKLTSLHLKATLAINELRLKSMMINKFVYNSRVY